MENKCLNLPLSHSSENAQYFKISNDSIVKLDGEVAFHSSTQFGHEKITENLDSMKNENGTNTVSEIIEHNQIINKSDEFSSSIGIDSLNVNDTHFYLEFAKDAFFYYMTAKKKQKNQHLKTLIDLFKYNENELKRLKEQNKQLKYLIK